MNRTIAPVIKDAIEFELPLKLYDKYILDNGVEVYAINGGAQDVLQVELVFYAGNSYEEKNGVAAATNYLLKNGTSTKTAFQINEHFEFYGSYCNRACYNETAVVSLHTLSKHLPELLPVMKEMITDSIFSGEELETYKQNTKQKLTVNLQKCDFVANRLIDACLFGETHPYGKYLVAGDYEALTREQLQAHFEKYYVNGRCIIFVGGKLPDNIETLLNQSFGKLAIGPREITTFVYPPVVASQRKLRITNDPEGVQGAIRIARSFPDRHHPDFMGVMVLNTVFGGFFGSRLMSNIREEKGYTYGIHSYVQNHIGETAWLVSTEAGKDVTEATVEEVYKEMKILREELIDEEELLLVRNYMIGSILGDLDGPFHIIGRWKNIILNNLDEQYFYDSIKTIKTISAESLQELSQKYLQPDDFYELVVI
ncbi:MAG: pitrilysin family protein [Bacteroidota bacterium]